MNERIKEFAEQAGFENGHQDRNGNSLSYELEKFALLIIQEYEKLLPEDCVCEEKGPTKGWWIGYAARRHFGIPI